MCCFSGFGRHLFWNDWFIILIARSMGLNRSYTVFQFLIAWLKTSLWLHRHNGKAIVLGCAIKKGKPVYMFLPLCFVKKILMHQNIMQLTGNIIKYLIPQFVKLSKNCVSNKGLNITLLSEESIAQDRMLTQDWMLTLFWKYSTRKHVFKTSVIQSRTKLVCEGNFQSFILSLPCIDDKPLSWWKRKYHKTNTPSAVSFISWTLNSSQWTLYFWNKK